MLAYIALYFYTLPKFCIPTLCYSLSLTQHINRTALQSLEAIFWDSGSASGLWAFTKDIVQGWARAILATKMSERGYLIPRYVYSGLLHFYLCLLYLLIPLPVIDFPVLTRAVFIVTLGIKYLRRTSQCRFKQKPAMDWNGKHGLQGSYI